MNTFVRAVVTGFAFSLGAMLFRKVAKKVGFEEDAKPAEAKVDGPSGQPAASS
ncbi:MAG: hypothetical protein IPI49_20240 [Myxococcales bacterium]|nr:hypothetical protein [Myxococcales bacterium]